MWSILLSLFLVHTAHGPAEIRHAERQGFTCYVNPTENFGEAICLKQKPGTVRYSLY